MRGKNEIYINQATMLQAVQLWLDDKFKSAPTAQVVKKNHNSTSGSDNFIVVVNGDAPEKTP